ncbi:MAG: fructose 1,6-bisphosphatase, partial [Nitrososphaerales archaeon]
MKITLSAIKADIGGIGGHTRPSDELLKAVENVVSSAEYDLLLDYYIGYAGDDIHISMSHE